LGCSLSRQHHEELEAHDEHEERRLGGFVIFVSVGIFVMMS
jgi:hypothetical protein